MRAAGPAGGQEDLVEVEQRIGECDLPPRGPCLEVEFPPRGSAGGGGGVQTFSLPADGAESSGGGGKARRVGKRLQVGKQRERPPEFDVERVAVGWPDGRLPVEDVRVLMRTVRYFGRTTLRDRLVDLLEVLLPRPANLRRDTTGRSGKRPGDSPQNQARDGRDGRHPTQALHAALL